MIKKARRMKVRFCGLSMWQMDLSSGTRVPSFFFLNKKRHPCKFLSELQALMSLPEKEGFELSPHQQSLLTITQSRPYRTVTRDAVTAALRSFPWEKRFLFCFSHLQRDPRVPSFFVLKQKKTSLQIPFGIASVDVFTGEGGI